MRKTNCLVLTREDLKPGFGDISFNDVVPGYFTKEVITEISQSEVVVFVNVSANQDRQDKRTRILKNSYGNFGIVKILS